jgi:hypothetical protein
MEKDNYLIIDDCFNFIDERKRPNWIKDDLSNKCLMCEKVFGWLRRKHHCRSCGGLFCYECSNNFIQIPKFIGKVPTPDYNPLDIKTYIPDLVKYKALEALGYNTELERVCGVCYKRIQNVNKISDLIKIFNNIVLDICCYKKMACVSKSWNKVAKFYISQFRQIQYYLPEQKLTDRECKMLWINRKYFIGHTRWIVIFTKSINWKNVEIKYKQELINIVTNKKCRIVSCKFLQCGQNCNHCLNSEDSILCLYPVITQKEIRNYVFEQLMTASVDELLCYLPYLVYNIRYYYNRARNKCKISNLLIHLSTSNFTFLNHFFWELNIQLLDKEYQSMYNNIKLQLLDNISVDYKYILQNSESFMVKINTIFKNSDNVLLLRDLIRDHLLEQEYFKDYPVSLPLDPQHLIIGINRDAINIKQSATCPIELPFICIKRIDNVHNTYEFSTLFKKEDVRKDYIVSKIIMLMDIIISKKLEIDLNLVHYNILPITCDSGFVEMVNNCETIFNIHERFKFTIQNFIVENNVNSTVGELREKFVKTCAGYCVITYLLGIGDRHLDNIMLTNDGRLFHIDFGYILGYDPKVFGTEIRLTSDMIDMMGGYESKNYKYFVELCNQCYNCIRQHSNLFYLLLGMLNEYRPYIDGKDRFSKTLIEKHIVDKFMPFESNNEAKIHIETKLANNSHETITTSVNDFFHYYNKETTNIFKKIWFK